MASANPTVPVLSHSQATMLSRAALVAAGALFLLALAKIVTSVLSLPSAPVPAILGLLQGGLTVLLGLILVKITTDLRYAREVPHLSGVHLMNALTSWQDFCKTLIGVAVVAFLGAMIRFAS